MVKPSLSELKELGKGYKTVPVAKEILSDVTTPIEVLKRLKKKSRHCYILESVTNQAYWGRYTFLGYDPVMEISCINKIMTVKNLLTGEEDATETDNPGEYLKNLLSEYTSPAVDNLPSFTGGLAGYFSYDYIKYSETALNPRAEDEDGFKDCDLMLFDKVIAFDNIMQKIILIKNISTERIEKNYADAVSELNEMEALVLYGEKEEHEKPEMLSEFRPLFKKEAFCEMVEKAKHYIYEGDIFQVVLSNRLEADFKGSLLDCYRVLRTTNPSPYMFYFRGSDMEIAGASPETLVKSDKGTLYTFPLAGTRPRGRTPEEDRELEESLLKDEKELSEHNMLVDLGRNDLGKISRFGTVDVVKYMSIERYSHVMHIGSTVKGEIAEGKSAIDAVNAVLPAGTLSGTPKIRACEIIDELENNKRGVYGGAIGYMDFKGNLDTCIAIRLAFKKNGKVFVRSGAGIVADSVPEKEYQECINKAKAVMDALKISAETDLK